MCLPAGVLPVLQAVSAGLGIMKALDGGGSKTADAAPPPAAPAAPQEPQAVAQPQAAKMPDEQAARKAATAAVANLPGASSGGTMLTGTAGVDPAKLLLGKNSLLGA